MSAADPPPTLPLAFFDPRTGCSALALEFVREHAATVLVYHDAPGLPATAPLVGAVVSWLSRHGTLRHGLTVMESSMPEHPAERFVYAAAMLDAPGPDGVVRVRALRVVEAVAVAEACGISGGELVRTEQLVALIHRPRGCAFAGVRRVRVDTHGVGAGEAAA